MNQKKINKKIRNARTNLRELYTKYINEYYEVVKKIDNFLEQLENE